MHIPTLTRHPHNGQQHFCRFLCPNCTAVHKGTRTYTHCQKKGGEAAGGVILHQTCNAFKLSSKLFTLMKTASKINLWSTLRDSYCLFNDRKTNNNNNNPTRAPTLAFPVVAFMQKYISAVALKKKLQAFERNTRIRFNPIKEIKIIKCENGSAVALIFISFNVSLISWRLIESIFKYNRLLLSGKNLTCCNPSWVENSVDMGSLGSVCTLTKNNMGLWFVEVTINPTAMGP